MLFIGRDRDLGRGDIHVDITTVQIVRTQAFQVARQLLTGILVITLEERSEVFLLQFKQAQQLFIVINGVADNVDVANRRNRSFLDVDFNGYTVTWLLNDFCFNLRGVTALGHILALQLVTHTFQGGLLKNLAFGQPGLLQPLEQIFFLDCLVATDVDPGNGRALHQIDYQHTIITAQTDVLKEAGLEQGAGCLGKLLLIHLVTYVKWQGSKYATGRYPLQAIKTNIGNRKRGCRHLGAYDCGDRRG